jgi:multidrug resistance efflux pump
MAETDKDKKRTDEERQRPERRPQRWLWRLVVLIGVFVAIGGALWLIPTDMDVVGYGNVMAAEDAVLRPGVKGPVAAVLVGTADMVVKDQVLVQLDDAAERANLIRTQRRLAELEAELQQLRRSQEVQHAEQRAQTEIARVEMEGARDAFESVRKLHEKGVVSEQELQQAQLRLELAQARLDGARVRRDDLWDAQIQVQEARIETLRADTELCLEQVRLRQVRAPIDGRVVMHDVSIGQVVDVNQVLGQIFDESHHVIMARLPEGRLWFLKEGQPVMAETSSYPSSSFGYLRGSVDWVSCVVNPRASGDGSVTVCVRVDSDMPDDVELKPGMTSKIWVRAGKTRLLWRILPFGTYELIETQ